MAEVALKVDLGDIRAEITSERLAETLWDIRVEIKAVDGLDVSIIGNISCHINRNLSIDSLHIAIEVTLCNRCIIRHKLGRHSEQITLNRILLRVCMTDRLIYLTADPAKVRKEECDIQRNIV